MFFVFTPYALLLFLVAVISLSLILITRKKREEPGGYPLLGVLISLTIWAFFAGLSAGFSSIAYKIIATKLAYFGIVSLPINLLLFSLYYTSNEKWLNPLRIFLLWLIPFLGLFLILTNEQHDLIWTGFSYRTSVFGSALVFERGIGFWGLIVYFYSCVMFTIFIITWTAFQFRNIYRKNMTVLMVMVPFSLMINILYVFGVFPHWSGYDPTPFSLVIFSSLMVWSFNRHKFFDLSPIGREIVIDQMRAMLLILDNRFRVVDFNHSMQDLTSKVQGVKKLIRKKLLVGRPIQEIYANWPDFIDQITKHDQEPEEIELFLHQERFVFEVQKTAVENQDSKSQGFLVFLFDITDRVKIIEAEVRNREIAHSLREIALVVNSSLEPHKTLNLALDQIGKIIKYDFANISMLYGDHFVIEYLRGHENADSLRGLRINIENTPNQQALIYRQPVVYGDVQRYFEMFNHPPHNNVRSFLCLPMYAKDVVLGFLSMGSEKIDFFSNDDLSVASAFASQVAIALQNSNLYTQVNQNLNIQSIMNEIIRIGSTRLEKKEFARAVTDQIHRFIETPGVLMVENNPENEQWYFIDLYDVQEYDIDNQFGYKNGLTGYILEHGTPVLLNSALEIDLFLIKHKRENIGPKPKTFMGAPMISKDRVIGAIVAHDLERENAFSDEDYKLFLMIAAQATIGFENVRLINQLDYLAKTDGLTGIYNRGYFHDVSKNILNSVDKKDTNISMIMMDIDLFKGLNDNHGHHVGDLFLRKTVDICKSILREKDVIGRVGGEEFSIVLPDTTLEEAKKIAERIRSAVENYNLDNEGVKVNTTVSLGVASIHQIESDSLDELLQVSDQALYRAKADGRNRVRVYDNLETGR
ncbi:MAG TPA: histidine kinase N-terminal 7TM domain-containing protein [Anaerolineaceae bacterium]|nr:histidine kinase N-terminal 7TM domain-containing protein [Anaerolineaceae bacterium]